MKLLISHPVNFCLNYTPVSANETHIYSWGWSIVNFHFLWHFYSSTTVKSIFLIVLRTSKQVNLLFKHTVYPFPKWWLSPLTLHSLLLSKEGSWRRNVSEFPCFVDFAEFVAFISNIFHIFSQQWQGKEAIANEIKGHKFRGEFSQNSPKGFWSWNRVGVTCSWALCQKANSRTWAKIRNPHH